jgi:flagellar hook-associated protein 3 FlgL
VEQSLGFRRRLEASQTTRKNIGLSLDWLNATDKALDDMSSLLSRARMLAVKGANGTLGPDERSAVAVEVDGLLEQAVGIGNTRHGDHYLFSGFQVDTPTFDVTRDVTTDSITATTYNGDTGLINREVEPGTDMAINVFGDPLFSDAFDAFVELRDALQATPFSVDDVTSALDDIKTRHGSESWIVRLTLLVRDRVKARGQQGRPDRLTEQGYGQPVYPA